PEASPRFRILTVVRQVDPQHTAGRITRDRHAIARCVDGGQIPDGGGGGHAQNAVGPLRGRQEGIEDLAGPVTALIQKNLGSTCEKASSKHLPKLSLVLWSGL